VPLHARLEALELDFHGDANSGATPSRSSSRSARSLRQEGGNGEVEASCRRQRQSRRPDWNRGPLHYEMAVTNSAELVLPGEMRSPASSSASMD
jgi:hypothetical protein